MSNISSQSGRWLAVALAGPILQGAILGLRAGPGAMLAFALGLPAIVAAVTLLTTPTLYVGGALVGGRLSLGQVAASTGRGLHALGLAMLGLAPLSLLLATTSALPAHDFFSLQLAALVVVALMIALHRLAGELDEAAGAGKRTLAWHLLFAGHTAIAFVLGARLFTDLVAFGERIAS
jgi:hypothetical protein